MEPFDHLVMAQAAMDERRREWVHAAHLRQLRAGKAGLRLGPGARLKVAFTGRLDLPETGLAIRRQA